jgi:hypothetical protein
MALAAFLLLSLGVLLGLALVARIAGAPLPRGWTLGIVHGGLGAAACGLIALALATGRVGGKLALSTAGLVGLTLALGLAYAALSLRGRRAPFAILWIHAILGWFGYLLLVGFAVG